MAERPRYRSPFTKTCVSQRFCGFWSALASACSSAASRSWANCKNISLVRMQLSRLLRMTGPLHSMA